MLLKLTTIAVLVLVGCPVWAAEKCMWFNNIPKTSFEQTIKFERIKSDLRANKIKYDKLTEKQIYQVAFKLYCEN